MADTSIAENEARVAVADASIAENEARVVVADAPIAENEASIAMANASIAENEASAAVADASIAENEASAAVADASIAENEASAAVADGSATEHAMISAAPPFNHTGGTMTRSSLRPFATVLALGLAVACAAEPAAPTTELETTAEPAAAAEQGAADPEAAALAERVLEALGGEQAWNEARFLRFGFAGRRQHAWDRATGLHRVEGETEEGEKYVVIHDLDTREGRAWLAGEEVSGERADELLENAYGAWVNDTYWLLMPYKLRDPGVTLAHEGTREVEGAEYQVLRLSFADVGLTPGDRYWAYVDPESGRMDYWAFHLESMEPDAEPVLWRWADWQPHGGIRLASRREQVGGDRVVDLSPIEVSRDVPEGVFDGP